MRRGNIGFALFLLPCVGDSFSFLATHVNLQQPAEPILSTPLPYIKSWVAFLKGPITTFNGLFFPTLYHFH